MILPYLPECGGAWRQGVDVRPNMDVSLPITAVIDDKSRTIQSHYLKTRNSEKHLVFHVHEYELVFFQSDPNRGNVESKEENKNSLPRGYLGSALEALSDLKQYDADKGKKKTALGILPH